MCVWFGIAILLLCFDMMANAKGFSLFDIDNQAFIVNLRRKYMTRESSRFSVMERLEAIFTMAEFRRIFCYGENNGDGGSSLEMRQEFLKNKSYTRSHKLLITCDVYPLLVAP